MVFEQNWSHFLHDNEPSFYNLACWRKSIMITFEQQSSVSLVVEVEVSGWPWDKCFHWLLKDRAVVGQWFVPVLPAHVGMCSMSPSFELIVVLKQCWRVKYKSMKYLYQRGQYLTDLTNLLDRVGYVQFNIDSLIYSKQVHYTKATPNCEKI